MDILVMEIKLAVNMWKQILEIANQFEDLEYFVQQGGKKSIGTGVFLVLWFPDHKKSLNCDQPFQFVQVCRI